MEEKGNEAYKVNEDHSGIKDRRGNNEKVDHNTHNNNGYLLASSVWNKTGFRDHNMLVYQILQPIERYIQKVQRGRLITVKWSSWLQHMTRLIGSKSL
ncbi:MAG: hypothetical protein M3115_01390 [Thermoproteota archaeon]|nr:hypothetical protein [Thermoproteota archaeon]